MAAKEQWVSLFIGRTTYFLHCQLGDSIQQPFGYWPNCHVLTLVPFLCLYFSLVRVLVGVGILCFWPGMVPNQRQLSIVVSD
jgi:hypothetical protein